MKSFWKRYIALLRGHDKGTVALTFIVCLPILLFIIGILSEYALIVNARIMLNHATAAAARSAMTALPTDPAVDTVETARGVQQLDGVEFVNRAARMQLAALSPRALGGGSDEGTQIEQAFAAVGIQAPNSFAARYTFAAAATTVSWQRLNDSGQPINEPQWQPADFAKAAGQRIQLTVQYNFLLNVPGVKVWGPLLTGQSQTTIGGVTGYFLPMTSRLIVQLSSGREAATDGNGFPLQP